MPLKLSQELGQLGTFTPAQCAHPVRLPAMHRTANFVGHYREVIAALFEKYDMALLGPPLSPD
jgi:hypothetical protein